MKLQLQMVGGNSDGWKRKVAMAATVTMVDDDGVRFSPWPTSTPQGQ
jgi:hypothetical protein